MGISLTEADALSETDYCALLNAWNDLHRGAPHPKYKRSELNRIQDGISPKHMIDFNELVMAADRAGDIEEDVKPLYVTLREAADEEYQAGALDRLIAAHA